MSKYVTLKEKVKENQNTQKLTPWDRVQEARSKNRPYSADYINHIFDGFLELHGDRYYGDDRAVIGGIASLEGRYVTVIGQQKGRSAKEMQYRNFGMPNLKATEKPFVS